MTGRKLKRVWRLIRRVAAEVVADDLTGEAAKAAYYFFLSLFPLLLTLFAVTGLVGGADAFNWLTSQLQAALPGAADETLKGFVREITGTRRPGILSLGVVLTAWAASSMFAALTRTLNVVYDLEEDRPWWKQRAIALGVLVLTLLALALGAAAVLAGPDLVGRFGLGLVWMVMRWPLVFVLIAGVLWLVYRALPNRDQRGAGGPIMVGAAVGAGLWMIATFAFRVYVANFGSYSATYGFVGAVMVLLIWLDLTALCLLLGGEVAATLEEEAGTLEDER